MQKEPQIKFVRFMTAAAILAGAGCAGETVPENPAEPIEPALTCENTDWVLTELNGEAVEVAEPMTAPSIRFDRETHLVAGNGGVNRFSGGYALTDGSIKFGPMRSTMMAGRPEAMELESSFMKALEAVTGWRIVDGALEFLGGETVIARFSVKQPET